MWLGVVCLPREMWDYIISYLDAWDMMQLCRVNHDFYAYLSQPHLWSRFIAYIQQYDHQRYTHYLTAAHQIAIAKGWAALQHMTQRMPRDIVEYGIRQSRYRLGQCHLYNVAYNLSAANRLSRMLCRLHAACKHLYISILFDKRVSEWCEVRVTHSGQCNTGFYQVAYVERRAHARGGKRKRHTRRDQDTICELNWSRLYVSLREYVVENEIQSFDSHWESILTTQRGTLIT